jgi:hypothetical protein
MCDCEELEFEDFEVMLTALSKKSPPLAAEAPPEAPVLMEMAAKPRK